MLDKIQKELFNKVVISVQSACHHLVFEQDGFDSVCAMAKAYLKEFYSDAKIVGVRRDVVNHNQWHIIIELPNNTIKKYLMKNRENKKENK